MPTVKEIYDRHMKNIGDECISVFGYTGSQVCEALEFWERNKPKQPLVRLFEEITPDKGVIRLMKNENSSYTLWYHGQKVWGNE